MLCLDCLVFNLSKDAEGARKNTHVDCLCCRMQEGTRRILLQCLIKPTFSCFLAAARITYDIPKIFCARSLWSDMAKNRRDERTRLEKEKKKDQTLDQRISVTEFIIPVQCQMFHIDFFFNPVPFWNQEGKSECSLRLYEKLFRLKYNSSDKCCARVSFKHTFAEQASRQKKVQREVKSTDTNRSGCSSGMNTGLRGVQTPALRGGAAA